MNDPLLGGNHDELKDFSDVEPTVGATSPAATLPTANDASDSKTCTVLNLASKACKGQVNMATEVVRSNTEGKTNSNTEKEEKEKKEQVREEHEEAVAVAVAVVEVEDMEIGEEETKFTKTS
jgi:hypothetical protein